MFEGVELDDDDPAAWPDVAAQRLDHALRCAICGDLFTMPVSLARCTHTCE
jgi:E3 ubiquitin-protein ligase RAD18